MRYIFVVFSCLSILTSSLTFAFEDQPACLRDLETHFFQYEHVSQALDMHNVDPSQWVPINQKLQDRSRNVPSMVKERADRMGNSPLDYPFQPKVVLSIMDQVLFEIFTQVLYESNVTNVSDLRQMFAYIRRQQADKIERCIGIRI